MAPQPRAQAQPRVQEPSMPFTPWPPQEIVSFYHGALAIDCTIEDIVKPGQAFVMQFYGKILEDCWKITLDSASAHRMTYLNSLMHGKELYDDPIRFAMFFKHLKDLTTLCGVPSFNHSDLLRPEPIRFRSIVTAIANFLKFRGQNSEFFDTQVENLDSQRERIVQLEADLESVRMKIDGINQKNEENAPYITEAKHRNDALENETLQLRTESSKLHEQASLLKQERSLIIDEVTLKVDRVAELQETNERIRSRIVKSPERLKRGLEDMGRQQGEMRGALRDGARRGRELATRLDVMAGLELDLKGLIDLAQGIEADKKKLSELKMSIQKVSNFLGERTIENNAAISKIEQLERQIELANEKLGRQVQAGEDMRQKAKDEMDKLRADYALKAKDRTATEKQVELRRSDRKAIEDEMKRFKEERKRQLEALLVEYKSVRMEMESYMFEVAKRLGLNYKVEEQV